MNVLIIAQKEFPYKKNFYYGGIQKVEIDQAKCLALDKSISVDIFIPNDSERDIFEDTNVNIIFSSSMSQDNMSRGEKMKSTRMRQKELKNILCTNSYDCVIVHDWSTSIHSLFTDQFRNIPSIVFLHNLPMDSGGIQQFGRIDKYVKLAATGSIPVTVSNTCKNQWESEIQKKIDSVNQRKNLDEETIPLFKDLEGDVFHVMYPGVVRDKFEPIETEQVFCTMISRINQNKEIKLAAKITSELDIPLILFTHSPKNDAQREIIEEFKKYQPESNIRFDVNRLDMFNELRKSSLHIIPSYESFSLVAIEANSCGVPCLIVDRAFRNPPHEACQKNDIYNLSYNTKIKKDERNIILKEYIDNLPLNISIRNQIADNTLEYYSEENTLKSLTDLLKLAIERKESFLENYQEKNSLEAFTFD